MSYVAASAVLLHTSDDCTTQWSAREWILSLKLFSPCGRFPFTFVVQKSSCWSRGQHLHLYWSLQPLYRLNSTCKKLKYCPLQLESLEQRAEKGQVLALQAHSKFSVTSVSSQHHTLVLDAKFKCPWLFWCLGSLWSQHTENKARERKGVVGAAGIDCSLRARRIYGKRTDERRNIQQRDCAGFGWDS